MGNDNVQDYRVMAGLSAETWRQDARPKKNHLANVLWGLAGAIVASLSWLWIINN